MAVSKRVRYEVLRRDNHACRYCGGAAPDVVLTVDHVIPVALGGGDDPSNLVAACKDCNAGKTSTSPDAPVVADVNVRALEWAEAIKQAAEERRVSYARRTEIETWFLKVWKNWTYGGPNGDKYTVAIPNDFGTSIHQFLAAGLEFHDLEELVGVAMRCKTTKDEWKYFCGCCWRRVEQAQERATEIVSADDQRTLPAEFSTAYTNSQVVDSFSTVATRWRERFGTELATCVCANDGEFCGDFACTVQLIGIAQGVLLGPESAAQVIAMDPQVEECANGPY